MPGVLATWWYAVVGLWLPGWRGGDAVVGLWLPGLLAAFGVVGNALSLWVLSRDPAGTATLTSLKALALSDLVLLVGALCQQIVPMLCDFAAAGDTAACLRRGYLQVYAWPVVSLVSACILARLRKRTSLRHRSLFQQASAFIAEL